MLYMIKQVCKFLQFQVYITKAGVQICTLSSWSKLYKFVHLGLSVQICTLLTGREV